jgi:hypothetical protein
MMDMLSKVSRQRNQNFEIRSARHAVTLDQTMMLLDKGLRQSQPQARATVSSRNQWKENAVLDRVWNARPVVNDMQFQCQSVSLFPEGDLASNSGAQNQLGIPISAPIGQGQGGVVANASTCAGDKNGLGHGLDFLEITAVVQRIEPTAAGCAPDGSCRKVVIGEKAG